MNTDELITYLLTPVAQVALIMGMAELFKRMSFPKKYIPLIDLGLGIISGYGVYGFYEGYGTVRGILIGIALGLSACGLFSGIKNIGEQVKEDTDE